MTFPFNHYSDEELALNFINQAIDGQLARKHQPLTHEVIKKALGDAMRCAHPDKAETHQSQNITEDNFKDVLNTLLKIKDFFKNADKGNTYHLKFLTKEEGFELNRATVNIIRDRITQRVEDKNYAQSLKKTNFRENCEKLVKIFAAGKMSHDQCTASFASLSGDYFAQNLSNYFQKIHDNLMKSDQDLANKTTHFGEDLLRGFKAQVRSFLAEKGDKIGDKLERVGNKCEDYARRATEFTKGLGLPKPLEKPFQAVMGIIGKIFQQMGAFFKGLSHKTKNLNSHFITRVVQEAENISSSGGDAVNGAFRL